MQYEHDSSFALKCFIYLRPVQNAIKNEHIRAYDRTELFNDLPLLPPSSGIENDVDILNKLVTA